MLEYFEFNDEGSLWVFRAPSGIASTEPIVLKCTHEDLLDAFVKSKKEVSGMRLTVSSGVKKLVCHGTNNIPEDAAFCPDCAVRCAKAVVEPLQDGYVLSRLELFHTDAACRDPKQYRFKCEKCGCEWLWHQYDILGSGNRDLEKETTKCCCDGGCSCGKHE